MEEALQWLPAAQYLQELTSHNTSLAMIFTSLFLPYRMDEYQGDLYVRPPAYRSAFETVGFWRRERKLPYLWYDRVIE
jgi:hypothetical protein